MEKFLRAKSLNNTEAGLLVIAAFFVGHLLKQTDPRELQRAYTAGCLAQMRGQQQQQQRRQAAQQQGGWSQGQQQQQPSTAMQTYYGYDYGQQPQQYGQAGLVSYDPNDPTWTDQM